MNNFNVRQERHRKLIDVSDNQIKELRSNGYNIPFQDFDYGKIGFNLLGKHWTQEKKLNFAKHILDEIGMSFELLDNGVIQIAVDYQNKNLSVDTVKILLAEQVTVRVPEVEI